MPQRTPGSTPPAKGKARRLRLRVLLLEPFDTGSHRAFARGWSSRSRHKIDLLTLPARFWKWRLRGAAFAFAEKLSRRPRVRYDAIVATSLMNVADFVAVTRPAVPVIVYLHENQLSYPRPPGEPLDHGLALASLASAAAADAVVFNSAFHRREFFRGLEAWLARFPEMAPRRTVAAIRGKASVVHPGIDWEALARFAGDEAREHEGENPRAAATEKGPPLILWNHRWEFDKNPSAFFAALRVIVERGWSFRLALLGENSQFVPKPFLAARETFGPRIVQYGFVASIAAYQRWLGRADFVVSTARQENFGLSVAEAVAAGAHPVLPRRLSYPELLPKPWHAAALYDSQEDLIGRLESLLAHPEEARAGRMARSRSMERYDWSHVVPVLDEMIVRSPDFPPVSRRLR